MHELTDYTGAKHTLKQGSGNHPPYDHCDACSLRMMCGGTDIKLDIKCSTRTGSYYVSAETAQPLYGDIVGCTF